MKQILQNLKTGATELTDVPCPQVRAGHLLIRTRASLISTGTERMLVEFGKANLLEKIRQQPDKVRMVFDKIATDGLMPTLEAVRHKLDQSIPMGYCNVGEVMEYGAGVTGFGIGDRVVSNGPHAEIVNVPRNLCAIIPSAVDDEAAAFTIVGAIALQGIRLALPTLGESFVVTGLGLIGLLTVQLLRGHGCRVLGIDYDPQKLELARQFGAMTVDLSRGEDPLTAAQAFSSGRGVDGVLITASAKNNEPVHQAAVMCRKRGRIVLIGVVGLELSRADFYEKELSFQVSCSYGPGRYDPSYEQEGHDYPFGFVRWTAQRNFEAVLDMLSTQRVHTAPLISHRFPLDAATDAYETLSREQSALGILLHYLDTPASATPSIVMLTPSNAAVPDSSAPVIGVIGAGNHGMRALIPAFKKAGCRLRSVASSRGISGVMAGRKFGFQETTTDPARVMADADVDMIVIATRHESHARFVCEALQASKQVFVEKPLALCRDELSEIESVYASLMPSPPRVMVGFNRRFAPHITKISRLLSGIQAPKTFIMTVNAGVLPSDHWQHDPRVGGGRFIGEGCHFIDLLRYLAGSPIKTVQAVMIGGSAAADIRDDKLSATLVFEDGSVGTIHYFGNGHKSFPKERLEIFCAGRVLQLDNFRKLRGYGWSGFKNMNLWRQDKGQSACVTAFVDAIRDGRPSPIPFDELVEVTRVSFDIMDAVYR